MSAADDIMSLDNLDDFGDGTADVSMSTESPNPTLDDFGDGGSADNASNIINGVGQWGATIAGIFTRQPTISTPRGVAVGTRAVNAASPGLLGRNTQTSSLMIVLLIAGGVLLVVALMPNK